MTRPRTEHALRWTGRMALLPLVGLAAGLLMAALTTQVVAPTYTATASVIVAPTARNGSAASRLADVSLAQNLAASVAQLAQSREVAVAAAQALGLPEDEVSGHLTGDSQVGIQIVRVDATAGSPGASAELADAAAFALITKANDLRLGGSAVTVQALDQAGVPSVASEPRPLLIYALGGFVGLLVGIGLVSLRTRVADRFRTVSEIESELDLPAIGIIGRRMPRRRIRRARAWHRVPEVRTSVDGLVSALSVLVGRGPGRRIVVTGVGDEASAAFVGVQLALGVQRRDRHTTLLEGKLRVPVVHRYFPGEDDLPVREVLGRGPSDGEGPTESLTVLSAETVTGYFDLDPSFEQVGALIDALAAHGGDVVVVAPSVLAGRGLAELARHADAVVLTVDSDRTPRADAGRAAMLVQRLGVSLAAVVVTGTAAEEDGWQPAVWPTLPSDAPAPRGARAPRAAKKAP